MAPRRSQTIREALLLAESPHPRRHARARTVRVSCRKLLMTSTTDDEIPPFLPTFALPHLLTLYASRGIRPPARPHWIGLRRQLVWRILIFSFRFWHKAPLVAVNFMVSKGFRTAVDLVPDPLHKRYDIVVRSGLTKVELAAATEGTVRTDGRGQDRILFIRSLESNTAPRFPPYAAITERTTEKQAM